MEEERRRRIVAWVAEMVMPHEAKVRARLARFRVNIDDIDDAIQEAYCRLSALRDIDEIDRPDAYFFSTVRNLLIAHIKRRQVVRIELTAEIESLAFPDDQPSPERQVGGRIELDRVRAIVMQLPDRCRKIFEMRKIEGLSQREIARQLGVPEGTVENDAAKGLRMVLAALRSQEAREFPELKPIMRLGAAS